MAGETEEGISDLARALREARPSWMKDGLGIIGPQPAPTRISADLSEAPPLFDNGKRSPRQPFFPEAEPVVASTTETEAAPFPFKVSNAADEDGARVSIYPGYILNTVPKIGETLLSATPAPSYGVTTGTLYFKVTTKQRDATTNDFRAAIDMVEVEGRPSDDKEQLKITWTDQALNIGTFYIKVADILISGSSVGITQYLFNSYRSLAIIQDRVVLLA